MKAFFILFIFASMALDARYGLGADAPSIAKSGANEETPPTTTLADPVEVFQKAFWRRPTKADIIRHVERQEWKNETGVSQWRWFIVVKPSPALLKHLRENNPFSLVTATVAQPVKDAPAWFALPSGEADVLRAPQGGMQLVFQKKEGLLYATDSGGGFHPGKVVEPQAPSAPLATERRPLKLPPGK